MHSIFFLFFFLIEIGPLSEFNTHKLIRSVNSTLDLYCRSTSNASAKLLITHCKSSDETSCKNLTADKGPDSKVVVKFPSLKFSDSGSYTCKDLMSNSMEYISLSVKGTLETTKKNGRRLLLMSLFYDNRIKLYYHFTVKPETPETMDCVSPDFKELVCTWNVSNSHSAPTKWDIWYSWRPLLVHKSNYRCLVYIKIPVF